MVVASGVDQVFERAVDAGVAPGVVALAANDNDLIYEGAFGKREVGKDAAMTLDSVAWIASMTKAVTSAAAMQLVEQGRLGLDEPLDNVCRSWPASRFWRDSTPRARRVCVHRADRSRCVIC